MNLCPADPALRASECKALYVFKVNHFSLWEHGFIHDDVSLPLPPPNASKCNTELLLDVRCALWSPASVLQFNAALVEPPICHFISINLSTYPFLFIHLYSESACKEHDPLAFLWFGINEGKKGFCSFWAAVTPDLGTILQYLLGYSVNFFKTKHT